MSYYKSMAQIVDYIESNLTEEISLDRLAAMAHLSKFHFHRVFQAMVGEAVMEYIRLRRLTLAGQQLRLTRRRVVDIAFDYQFSSHENFCRAFKKVFGVTPSAWRRDKTQLLLHRKAELHRADSRFGGYILEPKIVLKDAFTVVGLEVITTQEDNNTNFSIPKLWSRFIPRAQEIKSRAAAASLGLCISEGFDDCKFAYLACVEVSNADSIPEGMVARSVPASKYLVFTHKGSVDELGKTYDFIYGTYIPNSTYEIASMVDFELYDERFNPNSPDSELDIYIPIK